MAGGSSTTRSGSSAAFAPSGESIERHFASELKSLRNLSDEEFANRMADVWLAREDAANLLSKAIFSEASDGKKAMAFYEEFKRRKGLSGQEDAGQPLWYFMFTAGQRNGAEVLQKMMDTHPGGILEVDTIVHGWITTEPNKAVEWLNSLPEDCPFYSKALKGIVWGIGEMSPPAAVDTFLKLPAEERNQKFESLAGGALSGHGFTGLNEIAALLPGDEDRKNLLMNSLPFAMNKSPGEFVDGMAGHLSQVQDLTGPFHTMAGRWVRSSPDEAISWFQKNAESAEPSPALRIMADRLSKAGHGDKVEAWLAAHPETR